MSKNPIVVDTLNTPEIRKIISEMYLNEKDRLNKELQEIDDRVMISYLRAYITDSYQELTSDMSKELFLSSLKSGFVIVDLIDEFIEKLNATKANIGDVVDNDVYEELDELKSYKDKKGYKEIYKELSKSNKEISRIINEYHGYTSINKLKKEAKEEGLYIGYKISEEEIEIIERTKKFFMPNQLAHMLYDEKKDYVLYCDHEIKSDDELIKKLLVSTHVDNPNIDIVFPDGVIMEYFKGDIRIKPYNYSDVIEFTKLFYIKNYDEMKECYESDDDDMPTYEVGRRMILNSFINVRAMLYKYEDIYTQKMIEDSKKVLAKLKETSKKYDL